MHNWGEKNFDWAGLDEAIIYINKNLKKWRISVRQSKEKYGSARIYCSLGWNSLLSITHPGYCWYPYPRWLQWLDIFYLSRFIRKLNFIIMPIHKWAYRRTYKKACEMYPHLITEICCMADYVELLDFYKERR